MDDEDSDLQAKSGSLMLQQWLVNMLATATSNQIHDDQQSQLQNSSLISAQQQQNQDHQDHSYNHLIIHDSSMVNTLSNSTSGTSFVDTANAHSKNGSTWSLLLSALFQSDSSNEFQINWPYFVLALVLIMLMLTTAVGNLFVIVAILIERNLRTIGNYLVLSLAIADLLVACLVMPLAGIYQILDRWTLGVLLCDIWTSADVFCCTASILHLLAIALDRYWAVTRVDYIRCQRNEKRILFMIFFVWMAACVISLAPVFGWKDAQYESRITNEKECLISQDVGYQIFATCTTFYFPLILTLIFYWKIYQVARKRIRGKLDRHGIARQRPATCSSSIMASPTKVVVDNASGRASVELTKQAKQHQSKRHPNRSSSTSSATTMASGQSRWPARRKCNSIVRYLPRHKFATKIVNLVGLYGHNSENETTDNAETSNNNNLKGEARSLIDSANKHRARQKKACTCICHRTNQFDAHQQQNWPTSARMNNIDADNQQTSLNNQTRNKQSDLVASNEKSITKKDLARQSNGCNQCAQLNRSKSATNNVAKDNRSNGDKSSKQQMKTTINCHKCHRKQWPTSGRGSGVSKSFVEISDQLGTTVEMSGRDDSLNAVSQQTESMIMRPSDARARSNHQHTQGTDLNACADVECGDDDDDDDDDDDGDASGAGEDEDDSVWHNDNSCASSTGSACGSNRDSSVASVGRINSGQAACVRANRHLCAPGHHNSSATARTSSHTFCNAECCPNCCCDISQNSNQSDQHVYATSKQLECRDEINESVDGQRRALNNNPRTNNTTTRQGVLNRSEKCDTRAAGPSGPCSTSSRLMCLLELLRHQLKKASQQNVTVPAYSDDNGAQLCADCHCPLSEPSKIGERQTSAGSATLIAEHDTESIRGPGLTAAAASTATIAVSTSTLVAAQSRQSQQQPKSKYQLATSTNQILVRSQAASTLEGVESKRERKAAKTLAIITGVFVMCWLPFFIMAITMPLLNIRPHKHLFSFLLWLGYVNSMLNPIIYTIFSPDFRKAFKRLLCAIDQRHQRHQAANGISNEQASTGCLRMLMARARGQMADAKTSNGPASWTTHITAMNPNQAKQSTSVRTDARGNFFSNVEGSFSTSVREHGGTHQLQRIKTSPLIGENQTPPVTSSQTLKSANIKNDF